MSSSRARGAADAVLGSESLRLFHELPVLVTDADGAKIAMGNFGVLETADAGTPPKLNVEFTLDGVAFVIGIPTSVLSALATTWTGEHFVLQLPAGERVWFQPPGRE